MISIGDISLTTEEFEKQVEGLLTKAEIQNVILSGKYVTHFRNGEIKWCPKCKKISQTTCCACGCGNCKKCGYRWSCFPRGEMFFLNPKEPCEDYQI